MSEEAWRAHAKQLEKDLDAMEASNLRWKKRAEEAEKKLAAKEVELNNALSALKSEEAAHAETFTEVVRLQEGWEDFENPWVELVDTFVGFHGFCKPCAGDGTKANGDTCQFCGGTGRHERPDANYLEDG